MTRWLRALSGDNETMQAWSDKLIESKRSGKPYWSQLSQNIGFVGSALGGISIVSLICSGFNVGWTVPLQKILEYYQTIMANIRAIFEPLFLPVLEQLAKFLNFQFTFGPQWTDIFVLMAIYLGSRVKSYFSVGKYVRAITMLLTAGFIALVSSMLGSTRAINWWSDAFLLSTIPLLGFLVYDLLYAFVGATFDRKARQSWFSEYIRHIGFSLPVLVLCFAFNGLMSYFLISHAGFTGQQTVILTLLTDYCLISLFWAYKSWVFSSNRLNRSPIENTMQRFLRSSATLVSINVAIVILSGLIQLLFNGGLIVFGAATSSMCS